MTSVRMRCVLAGVAMLAGMATMPIGAQTPFHKNVVHQAAPVFVNLATFAAPVGAGTSRLVVMKLLTNNPGTGTSSPTFQVQRVPAQAALVQPDQPADGDDAISEPPLSTPVASASAMTASGGAPCPTATVAAGYQMICIIVQFDDSYTFAAAETWQLNVLESATADYEYFGWVPGTVSTDMAAAEAAVTRPKLWAQADLQFGGVQRSIIATEAPVQSPMVRNLGTASLIITGGPIINNPAPTYFSAPVFAPSPIEPGGTLVSDFQANQGIWIQAIPGALGARTSTLNLTAGSDIAPVTLTATGITFYGHMLLDCSGSMSWRPNGEVTSTETETRLYLAKQPAKEINNWVKAFTGGQGYLGLSTFPQCGGGSMVRVPIDVSNSIHPSINLLLGPAGAGGLDTIFAGTPMQAGIQAALGDMEARIANASLPPNEADRPNLRQSILMLTDGAENSGSNAAATIPALSNKGVRMYTIGYGVPGASDVDHALLSSLAAGTGGESWDANSLNPFELANAFKNAIRHWLDLESLADPTGVIRAGQSRQHKVCVDDRTYGLTFVADWDRVAPGGISFTLVSPTGEVITPATPGVSYFHDQMFAQYVLRGSRVRGGAGAGLWTLNLTGASSLPSTEDTRYSYSAMAQTSVRVEPVPPKDPYATGPVHLIEVRLINWPLPPIATPAAGSVGPAPVITVHVDAPASSFGTYLATGAVERAWFFSAKQLERTTSRVSLVQPLFAQVQQEKATLVPVTFMGEPATISQRKAWAIAHLAKHPFDDKRIETTLPMYDDGTHGDRIANDGIYTATAPAYRVDGSYRFAFEVNTPAAKRTACIERDIRVSNFVMAHLTPPLISKNVTWYPKLNRELFFDPDVGNQLQQGDVPPGFTRSVVSFTPMDEFGNHWGLGRSGDIHFSVQNGKTIGPVIDNWNGSYLQVLEHPSNVRPTVVVDARGVKSDPIELRKGGIPWWVLIMAAAVALVVVVLWRPWQ